MKRTRILSLTKLTEERKAQIRELEAACRAHDGTEAVAELSGDMNFSRRLKCFFMYCEDERPVGYMEIFCPDGKNAELTAFVEPSRRQQGIFSAMYEAADTELLDRGVRNILVVAEPASADAAAAAKKMGAELRYSELMMRLEEKTETGQEQVRREDLFLAVSLVCEDVEESLEASDGGQELLYKYRRSDTELGDTKIGNAEIGHAGVYVGAHELFIYGVEIDEKSRGKGHGTAFTHALIRELKNRFPDRQIKLQVRSDNVPAMKLYERCGFTVETQRDYYAIRSYT